MIMARNEDGTYSQVGFVKDNDGIDTEYIYDKDGDIVFEKGFTRETSGTIPLTINRIGKNLKGWSITGNTVQDGTPTPENPVDVQSVGGYDSGTGMYKIPVVTRGKNLAGNYTVSSGYYYDDSGTPTGPDARFVRLTINVKPNTIYTISSNLQIYSIWACNNDTRISRFSANNSNKYTIKATKECNSLRISMINTSGKADTSAFKWIQLEEGSTDTPYEPYHEPITTNIYLPTPLYSGEVLRSDGSREVKWEKLVLTGKENILKDTNESTNYLYYMPISTNKKINGYCSHLISRDGAPISVIGFNMNSPFPAIYFNFGADIMNAQPSGNTMNGFKEYLTAQYAAGTPVTVWYQLAKPTTETFTAPQIPTLDGTTVIDVNTKVKPTEMYIKYKSNV